MKAKRREHQLQLTFNGRRFTRVLVDPHYEVAHPDMNDPLVLELVNSLDGTTVEPVGERDGFLYFAVEVGLHEKHYRIVLTYSNESYLGIVNAFRVKEKT